MKSRKATAMLTLYYLVDATSMISACKGVLEIKYLVHNGGDMLIGVNNINNNRCSVEGELLRCRRLLFHLQNFPDVFNNFVIKYADIWLIFATFPVWVFLYHLQKKSFKGKTFVFPLKLLFPFVLPC